MTNCKGLPVRSLGVRQDGHEQKRQEGFSFRGTILPKAWENTCMQRQFGLQVGAGADHSRQQGLWVTQKADTAERGVRGVPDWTPNRNAQAGSSWMARRHPQARRQLGQVLDVAVSVGVSVDVCV